MSGLWWWLRSRRRGLKIFRFLYETQQSLLGSSISWHARIASRPCLPHGPKGIFIAGGATLGRDCVIFQQTTIGSNTLIDSASQGVPTIGDRCYIGAGAKIIGGIVLGDNVRVGANTVVHRDVPGQSVVTSGEMIVRHRENMDNRYYNHPDRWMCWEDGAFNEVQDERLAVLNKIQISHPESLSRPAPAGLSLDDNKNRFENE